MLLAAACAAALLACGDAPSEPDRSVAEDSFVRAASDAGLACAPATCPLDENEVCCVLAQSEYCAPASACSAGIALFCEGPSDCGGVTCCQPQAGGPAVCLASCAGATLCRVDADCPAAQPRCCGALGGASDHPICAAMCG